MELWITYGASVCIAWTVGYLIGTKHKQDQIFESYGRGQMDALTRLQQEISKREKAKELANEQ